MSLYLISNERERFEIKLDGTFKECFDDIEKLEDDIVYETQFSSKTIKNFQEYQKNDELMITVDEYIDLLLLTNQYFEEYFKLLCEQFYLFYGLLEYDHFVKIKDILISMSKHVKYTVDYRNPNDFSQGKIEKIYILFREKALINLSKKIDKNSAKEFKKNIIKLLCGNIVNHILIFMIDHQEILENINEYTDLVNNEDEPYFNFYHKLNKVTIPYGYINAMNKELFIIELHSLIYSLNATTKIRMFYESFFDIYYLKNTILIRIFGKQKKLHGLLNKNSDDFYKDLKEFRIKMNPENWIPKYNEIERRISMM